MVTNLSGLLGLADVMLHDDVLSICVGKLTVTNLSRLLGLADATLHDDALPPGPRAVELHTGPSSQQSLQSRCQLEQRLQQPVGRLQTSSTNTTATSRPHRGRLCLHVCCVFFFLKAWIHCTKLRSSLLDEATAAAGAVKFYLCMQCLGGYLLLFFCRVGSSWAPEKVRY